MIKRAILFGGKAIVSVLDTTDTVNEAIKIHGFSKPVATAMGKALTMTAFMSGNFKGMGNRLTVIIDGNGKGGKMVLCGDYGAKVRGYIENPKACDGEEANVSDIVGKDGALNIISSENPFGSSLNSESISLNRRSLSSEGSCPNKSR